MSSLYSRLWSSVPLGRSQTQTYRINFLDAVPYHNFSAASLDESNEISTRSTFEIQLSPSCPRGGEDEYVMGISSPTQTSTTIIPSSLEDTMNSPLGEKATGL